MRLFSAAAVACLFAAQAFAEPVIHACRVTKTDNFFANEILFSVDTASGEVMVVDPMIMYYNSERAVAAQLSENTSKKTSFKWTLTMTNASGQTTKMKFRGVLQRPSMRLLVSARPAGFNNNFTGRGSCAVTNAQLPGM